MVRRRARVCPLLGIMRDTATHMRFPSSDNLCFNSSPPNSPDLSYQQDYCLRGSYDKCALYRGEMDPMLSNVDVTASASGRLLKIMLVFIALLIVAGLATMGDKRWKNFLGDIFPASQSTMGYLPDSQINIASSRTFTVATASTTEVSVLGVGPVSISTSTPVLITADSFTPQPSDTATPFPNPHRFEVTIIPPGGSQGFLIHIVEVGETLDMIAVNYSTTVQAIMAVNYNLKPPIWAQYPIVIPVDMEDATGYPAFEVYVVEAYESISAESLASTLDVETSVLVFYNMCIGNCQFNNGDVLLVPRIQ